MSGGFLATGRPRYYDRDGTPLTLEQLASKFEDLAYRRVAEATVGSQWVSTVWLGIDHGFAGEPLYFETMIFAHASDRDRGIRLGNALYQERYGSEAEAIAGHARIVAALEAGTLELDA